MSLWRYKPDLDALNRRSEHTLVERLGIRFVDTGPDWLTASMPVDERTRQAYGILHGGATLALAETVGSVAGNLCVDAERYVCVGLEINANHIRPVRGGVIRATARALHLGSRTQVWEIRVHDERDRLICAARLTLAVVARSLPG